MASAAVAVPFHGHPAGLCVVGCVADQQWVGLPLTPTLPASSAVMLLCRAVLCPAVWCAVCRGLEPPQEAAVIRTLANQAGIQLIDESEVEVDEVGWREECGWLCEGKKGRNKEKNHMNVRMNACDCEEMTWHLQDGDWGRGCVPVCVWAHACLVTYQPPRILACLVTWAASVGRPDIWASTYSLTHRHGRVVVVL